MHTKAWLYWRTMEIAPVVMKCSINKFSDGVMAVIIINVHTSISRWSLLA